MTARLRRPSPALAIACLALFVALGGPAEAKKLINGKLIRTGTVSSKQIRDRGVTTADLSRSAVRLLQRTPARSVGTAELADGSVGPAQLKAGAVTSGALALNALTGASIQDGTIGTADLSDNAITSEKIGTSQVRKADIATGAVGTSEISAGSVTGNEVADGSLSARDMADFSGEVTVNFPIVPAGRCVSAPPTGVITPNVSGATLLDDVVLASPPQNWPEALTLAARANDVNTLLMSVCNFGATPQAAFTPTIRFLGIQP